MQHANLYKRKGAIHIAFLGLSSLPIAAAAAARPRAGSPVISFAVAGGQAATGANTGGLARPAGRIARRRAGLLATAVAAGAACKLERMLNCYFERDRDRDRD